METTHARQMRILAKTTLVLDWVNCGMPLENALLEVFSDYSDRQEFSSIMRNTCPSGSLDILAEKIKNKEDIPSAGVYFW